MKNKIAKYWLPILWFMAFVFSLIVGGIIFVLKKTLKGLRRFKIKDNSVIDPRFR